jgi:L-alanine-DL-glutamate epimerase and related enzymes of enolase superfamily
MTSLSHHSIARVDYATIGSVYPREVGRNSFLGSHGRGDSHRVIVLTTDRGAVGWGPHLGALGDPARFVGRSVAELIDPARGVIDDARTLDYALHDLAGIILDMPVYALLGDAGSKHLRVYSGGIYLDDLDPTDAPSGLAAITRNLSQDAALGFRDFKLKLGRGYRWMSPAAGLKRDIEVTRLARDLYPQARILVDANDAYSPNLVAEYLEATADTGLYWIEEMFRERRDDMLELRRLVNQISPTTLIADGEYRPDVPAVLQLAAEGLVDVLLMDVVGFGLTAWRQIMPQILGTSARMSPHAWGWPLKTLYAAQIGAGLGRTDIVEGVPGDITNVDASGYRFEDGVMSLPERPGFGLALLEDAFL